MHSPVSGLHDGRWVPSRLQSQAEEETGRYLYSFFVFQLQVQAESRVFPHRHTAGLDFQSDSPHIRHTAVLRTRSDTDTVPSPAHNMTALVCDLDGYNLVKQVHVSRVVSCLVTDVGHRVGRITAAGLTSRRSVKVPVLALIAEDAHHPLPAGTLSCQLVTETGAPQRTVSHLRPPPVTRALCQHPHRAQKVIKRVVFGIINRIFGGMDLTFAVLFQSVAVVTRFAVLAPRSHRVVEAAQAFSRHAVAGVLVVRVNVVVAETQLTASPRQRQVAVVTRAASVAVWS